MEGYRKKTINIEHGDWRFCVVRSSSFCKRLFDVWFFATVKPKTYLPSSGMSCWEDTPWDTFWDLSLAVSFSCKNYDIFAAPSRSRQVILEHLWAALHVWWPKFAVVVIGFSSFAILHGSVLSWFRFPLSWSFIFKQIGANAPCFRKDPANMRGCLPWFFAPNQNQKTSHTGMTIACKFFTVITLLNWGRRRALYCYIKRDREGDLVWLVVLQAPIGKDVMLPCMKATILEFCQFHASPAVHEAGLPCQRAPFSRFAWSFFLRCIFSVEQKRQVKKIYGKMRMKFSRLVHPALCFTSWIDRCDRCSVLHGVFVGCFWSP